MCMSVLIQLRAVPVIWWLLSAHFGATNKILLKATKVLGPALQSQITYLIYMGDISNAEGDGINIELVIIKGQLLCIPNHPWQTCINTQDAHKLRQRQKGQTVPGRILKTAIIVMELKRKEPGNVEESHKVQVFQCFIRTANFYLLGY